MLLPLWGCSGSPPVNRINQLPVANAGSDQTVNEQAVVILSGSGSDPDGSITRYSWTQVSGTTVVLVDAGTASASFSAADIEADETLTFRLTIVDNDEAAASDLVNITRINQSSVGGTVSGLVGTLTVENNAGDALTISSNGGYVFSKQLSNGALFNVNVVQHPALQTCSVSNASGQIAQISVTNVDIFCAPAGTRVSLSGSYQSAPLVRVDSDINDPLAEPNVDNGSFTTAQSIPNFSTVQGVASLAGTGRIAEGDRFASSADASDTYRVVLQQNQTLRLGVVNFSGTGVFTGDLDLYLYDAALNLVAFSNSTTEYEQVVVPAPGEYYIVVDAFSGTSRYTLSLDGVSVGDAGPSHSVDFKPGEAILKFIPVSSTASLSANRQSMSLSHQDRSRAARTKFDVSANSLSIASKRLQADFKQELAQRNPLSYQKYNTLLHIKRLNQRQDIEFAEPNYIYRAARVPDDQFYSLQWHYPAIKLPQAWDITTGVRAGGEVIVAVVDTGVFLTHSELAGQLVTGYDFIADPQIAADGDGIDANPDDPGDSAQLGSSSWHGTHVAGTVAALSNNTSGVAGVAWGAKIMPVRALGVGGGTGYDLIQALRYAAGLSNDSNTLPAQKADIINLSLGGRGFSLAGQIAVNAVRAQGVIIVAAAGNENDSQLFYPASYDGVVSVSATDFVNNRAPYSNFGSRVDVAAPGGNVGVDLNNDTYGDGILSTVVVDSTGTRNSALSFYHGTSMAAPHVAGVVALMRAVHPALSPADLDTLLSSGAITTDLGNTGRDDVFGHGLIDAFAAVQQAQQLANGGVAPELPALIVVTPSQITMGLASTESLILSNQGGLSTSVTSVNANVSWLSVVALNVDANGLGEYQIVIDRSGLSDSTYQANIRFNLATGGLLDVPVSIQVGVPDNSGNTGKIYLLLLDASNNSVVDQTTAIDQGNGVFNYTFANVAAGSYRIVGSSDIDNDQFICQLAEACGGYPTINALESINVVNANIIRLDFVIGILANIGSGRVADEGLNPTGIARHPDHSKGLSAR